MTSWFDESPETYDRARPSYPETLWQELFIRLPERPSLVEIGPGTGKATAALLAHGASVVACEPGKNLADYLEVKFEGQPLTVLNTTFEAARFPGRPFDGIVAATSFHWLNPWAAVTKTHSILKPGGVLAVVDTNQVADEVDRGYFTASHELYRRYFPDLGDEPQRVPNRDVEPAAFELLKRSDEFGEVELFRYDWDQRYETALYLDLVRSYSGTAQMEPEKREAFLAELGAFIDGEFGGYVIRPLVITLCCARRAWE